MKRNVVFSTLLSTALAVSLNAQSGSGSAAATPQDPAASTQSQVTVTGCLQNAEMAGTTGTSGSGSATGTASSASGAARAMTSAAVNSATDYRHGRAGQSRARDSRH